MSLEDYVARMKPSQKEIYFVIADTFAAAKSSPHLEVLRKKGIEVLLLSDRVDEWLIDHLREFDGKSLRNVGARRAGPRRGAVRRGKEGAGDALQGACRPGRAHQEVAAAIASATCASRTASPIRRRAWCSASTISARRCAAFSKPQARRCRRPSRCWRSIRHASAAAADRDDRRRRRLRRPVDAAVRAGDARRRRPAGRAGSVRAAAQPAAAHDALR